MASHGPAFDGLPDAAAVDDERPGIDGMPVAVAASVISAMPAAISAETLSNLPPLTVDGIIPGIPVETRESLRRRRALIRQVGIEDVGRKLSRATAETVADVLDGLAAETSTALLAEVGVDLSPS